MNSAVGNGDLLSAMASRLAVAERELKKKDFFVAELKAQNRALREQVVEMEGFLEDYGMKWVGRDRHEAPSGSSAGTGRTEDEARAKPSSNPTGPYKSSASTTATSAAPAPPATAAASKASLPFDLPRVKKNMEQLSYAAGEGKASFNKGGQVRRLGRAEELPVTFFRDGILIRKGPFRPYSDPEALAFLADLEDGYFPYELKDEYPQGVPFRLTDKTSEPYQAVPESDPFPGAGAKLGGAAGGDARRSRLLNLKSVASLSDGSDQLPRGDRAGFLSRLPERVIRNGRIIEVREAISVLIDTPLATRLPTARKTSLEGGNHHQGDEVSNILVRSEDGTVRFLVKLSASDVMETLYEYVALERCGDGEFVLVRPFPDKRELPRDKTTTMAQAGLVPNGVLCMTKR